MCWKLSYDTTLLLRCSFFRKYPIVERIAVACVDQLPFSPGAYSRLKPQHKKLPLSKIANFTVPLCGAAACTTLILDPPIFLRGLPLSLPPAPAPQTPPAAATPVFLGEMLGALDKSPRTRDPYTFSRAGARGDSRQATIQICCIVIVVRFLPPPRMMYLESREECFVVITG